MNAIFLCSPAVVSNKRCNLNLLCISGNHSSIQLALSKMKNVIFVKSLPFDFDMQAESKQKKAKTTKRAKNKPGMRRAALCAQLRGWAVGGHFTHLDWLPGLLGALGFLDFWGRGLISSRVEGPGWNKWYWRSYFFLKFQKDKLVLNKFLFYLNIKKC